jgi:hypothetical protein
MSGQIGLYLRYKNRADETVVVVHDDGEDAPEFKRFQVYNITKNAHYHVSSAGQWMDNLCQSPADLMYSI